MASVASAVNVLQLFGEPSRVRLLALLARQELTVAELTTITELGQSSVSTHLGRLREAGVVRDRKAGASTFYALNDGAMPDGARKVWELVQNDLDDGVLEADRARCEAAVRARAANGAASAGWPDDAAGQMERHYSPGRTWEATARGLLGLARLGDVLDAGSGDGTIAQLLAPRARTVTLVDKRERMIDAARTRLARAKNARFAVGDVEALPFDAASFDEVLLFNVLTHVASPPRALAEVARVLRPGGALALVTLAAHDHADVTAAYGELHAGFAPDKLRRLLAKAGFSVGSCDITSREKRPPHFEVVTAFATRKTEGPA
jgi:ArsR family transcriptional regulator